TAGSVVQEVHNRRARGRARLLLHISPLRAAVEALEVVVLHVESAQQCVQRPTIGPSIGTELRERPRTEVVALRCRRSGFAPCRRPCRRAVRRLRLRRRRRRLRSWSVVVRPRLLPWSRRPHSARRGTGATARTMHIFFIPCVRQAWSVIFVHAHCAAPHSPSADPRCSPSSTTHPTPLPHARRSAHAAPSAAPS